MEMKEEGVYRIDLDGSVVRVLQQPAIQRPNGITLSPDDSTLYVVDSNHQAGGNRRIWAFDILSRKGSDDALANQRVVYDFSPGRGADGLRVDARRGKFRPLGIPCIRDRVAQSSAMLVLEPIFEADLQPEQYGYRPGRSANEAVHRVHELLQRGRHEVVDGDLSNYFGEIPHAELIRSIARRVSDGRMLKLQGRDQDAPGRRRDRIESAGNLCGEPNG